jgi:hypothetical protein
MNHRARERTIAEARAEARAEAQARAQATATHGAARAEAQAMVDELERLVAHLRLARAQAGPGPDAETETGPCALPVCPLPSAPATAPPSPAAAPALSLSPPPPRALARPRRLRLAPALGLATVAFVGMVGAAAAVTVARDAAVGNDGMETMPYARTAPGTSASADRDATALPLASVPPVAAAAPPTGGPSASAAARGREPAEVGGGRHLPGPTAGPSDPDAFADGAQLLLLAQALKQAEEARVRALQALAEGFAPAASVPRLPPPYRSRDGGR